MKKQKHEVRDIPVKIRYSEKQINVFTAIAAYRGIPVATLIHQFSIAQMNNFNTVIIDKEAV
jgi:hypothetical protein